MSGQSGHGGPFPSHDHLLAHHGDFSHFRDAMIQTSAGRFGPIWWGVWDQHVRPGLAEDAVIVDLGTGPGLLLPMLRARHPSARIVGVEVQPVMLETLEQTAAEASAEVVVGDLAAPVPLEDGVADVVSCVMVFHELAFPPALLDEAVRLLKPGGHLVLYDWVNRPLRDYLGEDAFEADALTEGRLAHFREHCLFASEDLEFLCERVGLQVQETVGRKGGRFAIVVAEKA